MRVTTYRLHKAGNPPDAYEDAYAVAPAEGRFAISDGATESLFADRWAAQLVGAHVVSPCPEVLADLLSWLAPLQRTWFEGVDWPNLPWNALEKAEEGAYATLLGFTISPSGCWSAVAVGDSCLFQLRDAAIRSFPVARSEDFGNHPLLLPSNGARNGDVIRVDAIADQQALPRDRFFLMTDALAAWFLAAHERGSRPWERLDQLTSETDFELLIGELRATGELHNDDVTLIHIELSP